MGSYQGIPSPRSTRLEDDTPKGPVELVTMPTLGTKWGKDELKVMTKEGRKEEKLKDIRRTWKAFNRGQYRSQMAHPPHDRVSHFWALRRVCASPIFVHHAYPAVPYPPILAVLESPLPCVPDLAINGMNPLTTATGWYNQSISAEFSSCQFLLPGEYTAQVDTNSNLLLFVFKH